MSEPVTITACAEKGMVRCPRCWHWSYSMNFDNLCNRCCAIVWKEHPRSIIAASIIQNLLERGLKPEDNPEFESVKV